MFFRRAILLSVTAACMGYSLNAENPPASESISRDHMRVVLTVSGGVTGNIIPPKEVDFASEETKRDIPPDQLDLLKHLIAEARRANVFGHDFSAAPRPDLQTYTLTVDGDEVKWSEPGVEVPAVLRELRQWMMRNGKPQPRRPS